MKTKTIAIIVTAALVSAAIAGIKCSTCNGTGWRGSFKCTMCGGDGEQ